MKKNSLFVLLAALLLSTVASAQDNQSTIYPRAKNLDNNTQKDLLYTEFVMSDGKGWNALSEEKKGALLNLADDCKRMYETNKDLEKRITQMSKSVDDLNKKNNEAQSLAIKIATTIQNVYLKQPLSTISPDYLNAVKQILDNYKKEKTVKVCIKDIDSMIVWVKAYKDMDQSLNQPFNKSQVSKVLIQASKDIYGLKAKNKTQFDEFKDKYWQLYYYEASVKLFQNLIKTVNKDDKMKKYRVSGDSFVFEALVRYVNIWKELDNKKYEDKEKDVFKSFLFNNPYLKDSYQEYHMGMMTNPTQQNKELENKILQIKTN